MGILFQQAGGLLDAQDEAAAQALTKAASAPPVLSSNRPMDQRGSMTAALLDGVAPAPSYTSAGYEATDGVALERLIQGAEALTPDELGDIVTTLTHAGGTLRTAAQQLDSDLRRVLGTDWQGQFADSADTALTGFLKSADLLADDLGTAAAKVSCLKSGFGVTKEIIVEQGHTIGDIDATQVGFWKSTWQALTPTDEHANAVHTARQAAHEQAVRAMNTNYNPALTDADPTALHFTTAYRPVSGSPGDPNSLGWNTTGSPTPSSPAGTVSGTGPATAATRGTPPPAAYNIPGANAVDAATTSAESTDNPGPGTVPTAPGSPGDQPRAANPTTTAAAVGPGATATPLRTGTNRVSEPAGNVASGRTPTPGTSAGARLAGAGTLAGGLPSVGASGSSTGGRPGTAIGGARPVSGASTTSTSAGASTGRPTTTGAAMMGGAHPGAGQQRRQGHRAASYLVHATNTTEIIGEPLKASPAVLGKPTYLTDDDSDEDATHSRAAAKTRPGSS